MTRFTQFIASFLGILFFFLVTISPVLAFNSGPVNPYSFSAAPGSKSGTVQITWYDDGSLNTNYNLYYGTKPDSYDFAVPNLYHSSKQVNQFLVESLTPNQTYYFRLDGISGGTYFTSGPITAIATSDRTIKAQSVSYHSNKNSTTPYSFSLSYGSKSGTVNVTWVDNGTANKYDLVYGTKVNQYQYGAHDLFYQPGLKNTFTVGYLSPGKTYYFALVAERDNNVVLWSQPVAITVK